MRVIIAGSRNIIDYNALCEAIANSKFNITEIISGGARGVDQLGERYARENNIKLSVHLADWNRFGRSAGVIRNYKMAKHADAVIAIWDGESRGTLDMINKARGLNLNVYIHEVQK